MLPFTAQRYRISGCPRKGSPGCGQKSNKILKEREKINTGSMGEDKRVEGDFPKELNNLDFETNELNPGGDKDKGSSVPVATSVVEYDFKMGYICSCCGTFV